MFIPVKKVKRKPVKVKAGSDEFYLGLQSKLTRHKPINHYCVKMSKYSNINPVASYMKPLLNQAQGALKNLLEDAQLFQALLEVGQDCLPSELQPHLVGVSFEKNTLLLQLDEAIWATQLRFYEPNLLGAYQQHFPHLELNRVKVSVLPRAAEPKKKKKVVTHPTDADALEMLKICEKIKSKGLQDALASLSLRAKKNADS